MATENSTQEINLHPTPPPKPPRSKPLNPSPVPNPSEEESLNQPCDKSTQSGVSFVDYSVKIRNSIDADEPPPTPVHLTTVQNIYTTTSDLEEDQKNGAEIRRSSSRINKNEYVKLHRVSLDTNTSVNKLKDNFESTEALESSNFSGTEIITQQTTTETQVKRSSIGLLQAKFPAEALLAEKAKKNALRHSFSEPSVNPLAPRPTPRLSLVKDSKEAAATKTELLLRRRESIRGKEISAPQFPRRAITPNGSLNSNSDEEIETTIILRTEPEDIDTTVTKFLSEIQMEKPRKKTSGLRRIFGGGLFSSSKDKSKKDEEKNKSKYSKHMTGSSNSHQSFNTFDRTAPHRHTTGSYNTYRSNGNVEPLYVNTNRNYANVPRDDANKSSAFNDIQYNRMVQQRVHHQQQQQQQQSQQQRQQLQQYYQQQQQQQQQLLQQQGHPVQDYVCMDNGQSVKQQRLPAAPSKYIDDNTSSSSNTLSSENKSYNDNSPQVTSKLPKVENALRPKPPVPPKFIGRTNTVERYDRDVYANTPERFTETPPRASETRPNIQIVKPRAVIPINTERQLPNYRDIQSPTHSSQRNFREQLENGSARTLERNMNTSSKNLPDKNNVVFEETYGTVFDSLKPVGAQLKTTRLANHTHIAESSRTRSLSPERNVSSPTSLNSSPKSPSLEGTKLRLPSNRERVCVTPRITSPIDKRISTEKIIATELLKTKSSKENVRTLSPSHQRLETDLDYPDHVQVASLDRLGNERLSSRKSFDKPPQVPITRTQSLLQHSTLPMQPRVRHSNYDMPIRRISDSRLAATGTGSMTIPPPIPNSPTKEQTKQMLEAYYWAKKREEISREDPYSSQTFNTRALVHMQPRTSQSLQALPTMRSPTPVILMGTHPSPEGRSMRSLTPQLNQQRSMTPVNLVSPSSPQKQQSKQNVESYYWQELKKLKDQEERQLQMLAAKDGDTQRRSRSASPAVNKATRSMSLPRNPGQVVQRPVRGNELYGYVRSPPQAPIREGVPTDFNARYVCYLTPEEYAAIRAKRIQEIQMLHEGVAQRNNPNFVRGSPQRNTIGPVPGGLRGSVNGMAQQTYAPIFKRGSLTSPSAVTPESNSPKDFKRVSFSNAQNISPNWPTKNGFTQSPPQRRIDKRDASDDEVFLPNSPNLPNIANVAINNEPVYGQRQNGPQEDPYGRSTGQQGVPTSPTKTAQQAAAELYQKRKELTRQQLAEAQKLSPKGTDEDIYVRGRDKQITVNNKVCDMYGQIHDTSKYGVQKSGVLYGHLQPSSTQRSPQSNFVRGTRLSSSTSDMYARRQIQLDQMEAPNRPLPPLPGQRIAAHFVLTPRRTGPVSDNESGSEAAGEVQRIFQTGKYHQQMAKDRRKVVGE